VEKIPFFGIGLSATQPEKSLHGMKVVQDEVVADFLGKGLDPVGAVSVDEDVVLDVVVVEDEGVDALAKSQDGLGGELGEHDTVFHTLNGCLSHSM